MKTKKITANQGISVIIPTYNRESFLKETIQSVLNQDLGKFLEIIISDDGSTDKTLDIARTFGGKVKIIEKPSYCNRQGVAATRNRGIHASTKDFISFLDSDDFYLPGHLKKMISTFEGDQHLGFAFCRILEVKQENGEKLFRPWSHKFVLKNDVKNPVVSRSHIVHTNSFIFRRHVFDHVGQFNESYTNGEDGDLWMRISEKYQGKFLSHFGVAYRTNHGNSQLTKNSSKEIECCERIIFENAMKRYYDLKLRDQNRIFKIKRKLLRIKCSRGKTSLYHREYLKTILKYPSAYLQKFVEDFFEKLEKKSKTNWNDLGVYLKSE